MVTMGSKTEFGPDFGFDSPGHNSSNDAAKSYNEGNKLIKPISGLLFPNEDVRAFAETIQKVCFCISNFDQSKLVY